MPLKRYDLFTRVIGSLKKTFPGICAVHCGDGRDKNTIRSLIRELTLKDNLELKGSIQHLEVLKLMQQSKILLHTSSYEGLSTVCLEALYAGAHVISFCYPFEHAVPHWHVVHSKEEMTARTIQILLDPDTDYQPILLHSMDDSARAFMNLLENKLV